MFRYYVIGLIGLILFVTLITFMPFNDNIGNALFDTTSTNLPDTFIPITSDNVSRLALQREFEINNFSSLDWSSDGTMLAVSHDNRVNLYSVNADVIQLTQSLDVRASTLKFSPNEDILAVGHSQEVYLWDIGSDTYNFLFQLPYNDALWSASVSAIDFSPNGEMIVTSEVTSMYIRIWDAETGEELWSLSGIDLGMSGGGGDLIHDVEFSPDGRSVAFGHGLGEEHIAYIWYFDNDLPVVRFDAGADLENPYLSVEVTEIGFSPDGNLLASGSCDATVRLWDIKTGDLLLTVEGHDGCVRVIDFSPDGSLLASGASDGQINIWDVTSGEILTTVEADGVLLDGQFNPSGTLFVSGLYNGNMQFWGIR